MIELLHDRDADALSLMEQVMRQGDPLTAEYPLVFEREFDGRIVALGEGGEVLSACATLRRDFIVPGGTIRGGMIGSVATHPDHQGKGLGTRLLIEAEAALQVHGCVFSLLWGEDPRFYLARGYCPISAEEDFAISTTVTEALPAGPAREATPADAPAIHGLYERHPVRVNRTAAETAALLDCPGMKTLVLERDDEVVAFACRGRGEDLPDAIHEWGGPTEDVLALVRAHLEDRFPADEEGSLFMMAPTSAEELRHRLVDLGVGYKRGILGLGKLLSFPSAVELVRQRIEPKGTVDLIDTPEGQMFHIVGPLREGHLDADGMLALLMPATEVRGDVIHFLDEFGLRDALLPLEPFVWGLDSI